MDRHTNQDKDTNRQTKRKKEVRGRETGSWTVGGKQEEREGGKNSERGSKGLMKESTLFQSFG